MSEDTPHIESPDELEDDPRNGLQCFFDDTRICGADCMAYTTYPSESPALNNEQKHCVFIVGAERLGRYSGGIMSLLKKGKEDAVRKSPTPPDPMGGS